MYQYDVARGMHACDARRHAPGVVRVHAGCMRARRHARAWHAVRLGGDDALLGGDRVGRDGEKLAQRGSSCAARGIHTAEVAKTAISNLRLQCIQFLKSCILPISELSKSNVITLIIFVFAFIDDVVMFVLFYKYKNTIIIIS